MSFNYNIQDGYEYYTVPKNTQIFRGDTDLYKYYDDNEYPYRIPTYFTIARNYAEEYGIVFTFITMKEFKLLALDKMTTNSRLYIEAPNDIKRILNKQFGISDDLNAKIRDTDYNLDFKLVDYICKLNFDGYAIGEMSVTSDKHYTTQFHPELAICDPSEIKLLNPREDIKKYTQSEIYKMIEKRELKKQSIELKESRKKKKTLYDNDISRVLFAGKKHKKTNKKYSKKHKKHSKKRAIKR